MNEVVVFDTQHSKPINDCVLDYYAKRLATCSSDNSVKVFDVSSLSSSVCIAELRDHSSAVWRVCWSHPKYGGLLASCSYDKSIIVYKEIEANKYGKIYINTEHKGSINSIEWAPYELGLHLGCASSDGYISIVSYNLNKENSTEGYWHRYSVKAHLNGVSCISWEKKSNAFENNKNLNETSDQYNSFKLVSGGFDNQVIVWLFDNNSKEFHKLFQMRDEPHKSSVKDVAWKPNTGNSINIIASCSDQQIIFWEEDVNTNVWVNKQTIPIQHKIDKITWSPNGTILAVSCDNENVFLYKENEEGIWNVLCNLGSCDNEIPSNSVDSGLKEFPEIGQEIGQEIGREIGREIGYNNTNVPVDGREIETETERRQRQVEQTPYNYSYQQTPMYMQQGYENNPNELQNRNYNVGREEDRDTQRSHSHIPLNSMDISMNVGYTQQGIRNVTERSKGSIPNNIGDNFNRNISNNESLNMPNRYQPPPVYVDKNIHKSQGTSLQGTSLKNENFIPSEQFQASKHVERNVSSNVVMNNIYENSSTHLSDNNAPPSQSNKYGIDKNQKNVSNIINTPLPPTAVGSNFPINNNTRTVTNTASITSQHMQMSNMNYSRVGSSAFMPSHISTSGVPLSTATNPNTNYISPPSQQQVKNLNRHSISISSSNSACIPPTDISSQLPLNSLSPPRTHVPNTNITKQPVESASSPPMPTSLMSAIPKQPQTQAPPFKNIHAGMNTGNIGESPNSLGQVNASNYVPSHQSNLSTLHMNNINNPKFAPFNQNVNKGMVSSLNMNNNDNTGGGIGNGTGMGNVRRPVSGISHEQSGLQNASSAMDNVKSMHFPPPPPPPTSLQTGSSGAQYGKPVTGVSRNNTGIAGNLKPHLHQNEYVNFSGPPPMNKPMS